MSEKERTMRRGRGEDKREEQQPTETHRVDTQTQTETEDTAAHAHTHSQYGRPTPARGLFTSPSPVTPVRPSSSAGVVSSLGLSPGSVISTQRRQTHTHSHTQQHLPLPLPRSTPYTDKHSLIPPLHPLVFPTPAKAKLNAYLVDLVKNSIRITDDFSAMCRAKVEEKDAIIRQLTEQLDEMNRQQHSLTESLEQQRKQLSEQESHRQTGESAEQEDKQKADNAVTAAVAASSSVRALLSNSKSRIVALEKELQNVRHINSILQRKQQQTLRIQQKNNQRIFLGSKTVRFFVLCLILAALSSLALCLYHRNAVVPIICSSLLSSLSPSAEQSFWQQSATSLNSHTDNDCTTAIQNRMREAQRQWDEERNALQDELLHMQQHLEEYHTQHEHQHQHEEMICEVQHCPPPSVCPACPVSVGSPPLPLSEYEDDVHSVCINPRDSEAGLLLRLSKGSLILQVFSEKERTQQARQWETTHRIMKGKWEKERQKLIQETQQMQQHQLNQSKQCNHTLMEEKEARVNAEDAVAECEASLTTLRQENEHLQSNLSQSAANHTRLVEMVTALELLNGTCLTNEEAAKEKQSAAEKAIQLAAERLSLCQEESDQRNKIISELETDKSTLNLSLIEAKQQLQQLEEQMQNISSCVPCAECAPATEPCPVSAADNSTLDILNSTRLLLNSTQQLLLECQQQSIQVNTSQQQLQQCLAESQEKQHVQLIEKHAEVEAALTAAQVQLRELQSNYTTLQQELQTINASFALCSIQQLECLEQLKNFNELNKTSNEQLYSSNNEKERLATKKEIEEMCNQSDSQLQEALGKASLLSSLLTEEQQKTALLRACESDLSKLRSAAELNHFVMEEAQLELDRIQQQYQQHWQTQTQKQLAEANITLATQKQNQQLTEALLTLTEQVTTAERKVEEMREMVALVQIEGPVSIKLDTSDGQQTVYTTGSGVPDSHIDVAALQQALVKLRQNNTRLAEQLQQLQQTSRHQSQESWLSPADSSSVSLPFLPGIPVPAVFHSFPSWSPLSKLLLLFVLIITDLFLFQLLLPSRHRAFSSVAMLVWLGIAALTIHLQQFFLALLCAANSVLALCVVIHPQISLLHCGFSCCPRRVKSSELTENKKEGIMSNGSSRPLQPQAGSVPPLSLPPPPPAHPAHLHSTQPTPKAFTANRTLGSLMPTHADIGQRGTPLLTHPHPPGSSNASPPMQSSHLPLSRPPVSPPHPSHSPVQSPVNNSVPPPYPQRPHYPPSQSPEPVLPNNKAAASGLTHPHNAGSQFSPLMLPRYPASARPMATELDDGFALPQPPENDINRQETLSTRMNIAPTTEDNNSNSNSTDIENGVEPVIADSEQMEQVVTSTAASPRPARDTDQHTQHAERDTDREQQHPPPRGVFSSGFKSLVHPLPSAPASRRPSMTALPSSSNSSIGVTTVSAAAAYVDDSDINPGYPSELSQPSSPANTKSHQSIASTLSSSSTAAAQGGAGLLPPPQPPPNRLSAHVSSSQPHTHNPLMMSSRPRYAELDADMA